MFPTGSPLLSGKPAAPPEYSCVYGAPLRFYEATTVFTQPGKTTQLPRAVLITRIACCILISVAFYFSSIWIWPIACYVAWLVYTQVIAPDPMLQTMYEICGGKSSYESLPFLEMPLFRNNAQQLKWDKLPSPLYRITLKDQRRGLIVKAMTAEPVSNLYGRCRKETLFIFLEKLSPSDSHKKSLALILYQALTFSNQNRNTTLIFADDNVDASRHIFLVAKPLLFKTNLS